MTLTTLCGTLVGFGLPSAVGRAGHRKKAHWEPPQDLVVSPRMKALIFDLDGTLVDSVYAHVLAWQLAFSEAAIPIDGWRLHRRIGMSGGLFKRAACANWDAPSRCRA